MKKAINLYPKLTDKQIINKIKSLLRNYEEDPNNDFRTSGDTIIYHADLAGSYQCLIDWVISKNRNDLDEALWYLA